MFLYAKGSLSLSALRKDHEKAEFEVHEVYAVDVLISTGEGKVKTHLNITVLSMSAVYMRQIADHLDLFLPAG